MAQPNEEAPEADLVEQATVVGDDEDDPVRTGDEVNEADAVEQARVVRAEEDDYR